MALMNFDANRYTVVPIPRNIAQKLIVANHYLHRKASCSWAYGLFEIGGQSVLGVVMFGSPVSSTLCKGICGEEERNNVIELTRLWVSDSLGRNSESWFVSRALKLVPKDIVVSFADPSAGHQGYIYQALNFLYTGLGPPRKKWVSKNNPSLHFHRGSTAGASYEELRQRADVEYVPAVRKHRYIWFQKARRKELLAKLQYPLMPYPKGESCSVQATQESQIAMLF